MHDRFGPSLEGGGGDTGFRGAKLRYTYPQLYKKTGEIINNISIVFILVVVLQRISYFNYKLIDLFNLVFTYYALVVDYNLTFI